MSVLILIDHGFEDEEVRQPLERLFEEAFTVTLAAPAKGRLYVGRRQRETMLSDCAFSQVHVPDHDVLILPGGIHASLEHQEQALRLVREFSNRCKPIVALSTGPALLAAAVSLTGRRIACAASVATLVRRAGAEVTGESPTQDGTFLTAGRLVHLQAITEAVVEVASAVAACA